MEEEKFSLQQIEKAKKKEEIIQRLLKGEKLKQVLANVDKELKYSAISWSRLKKKYITDGFYGLLDKRVGSTSYKVTEEIKSYIKKEKEIVPDINASELKERIRVRFNKIIDRSWILRILQRLNLKVCVGRPKKEITYDITKGKPVDHAGCWFLKGANYDMSGTTTITKVVKEKRGEYIAKYGVELDANHGYKKREVKNRTVIRMQEELKKNIRGLEQKITPIEKGIEILKKEIEGIEEVYQTRIKELNKEKNELHYKILLSSKSKKKEEYIGRLKLVENKMLELTRGNEGHLFLLRNKLEKKTSYEKGLKSQKENKKEEINSLDMEEKLYEVMTEKDNMMSNFKLLLYNLSRYVREQWFTPKYENATFLMMRDKFYSQDGYVKFGRRNIKVTLNPYDNDELQKDVEQACIKFNCADIRNGGRRLEIYVEPQEKTGGNPDVTKNLNF